MSQLDPPKLHAVLPISAPDGERRKVSRFPSSRICVQVIGFDALRAAGLQAVFENNAGLDVVIGDASALSVLSHKVESTVNIVVVGAQGGTDILKLIGSIREAHPDVPVLAMSHACGEEAMLKVLMLGAKGFLHDAATPGQFEKAVHMVATGSIWAPRRIQALLIGRLLALLDAQGAKHAAEVSFTGREQQVLNLLLDGHSNREIAGSLSIEERTVKSYVTRLMRKMGVKNRTALSVRAQGRSTGNPAPTADPHTEASR